MTRRDAFTGLRDPQAMHGEYQNQVPDSSPTLRQPVDLIPSAERKKKRSRHWEQVHRQEMATYRGIPERVVESIAIIAYSLSVPRDEVVRAFLERGVSLYRTGELRLIAFSKAQRMTLFPDPEKGDALTPFRKHKERNWLAEVYPVPERKSVAANRKKPGGGQETSPQWVRRVTFRIPIPLKEAVREIAFEHTLPVGEVVSFFVMEGVKAFQDGTLCLQTYPRSAGKTLFMEGVE